MVFGPTEGIEMVDLWRIGLTGGIGSGKSSVARILQELGAWVIDADAIVHELEARGKPGWRALHEEFGWSVLTASGDLMRRKLGARIFSDPRARLRVDGLIHPLVRHQLYSMLEKWAAAGGRVAVIDIPLLVENAWDREVDEVWVVYVTHEQQRLRIMARDGLGADDAERRIAAQLTLSTKLRRAHRAINNTGSYRELKREVEAVWLDGLDSVRAGGA